jgi:hypothetical protein
MRAHADAACRHLIVNERREAGASLPHTHAQLYALDFVPAQVARERERFTAHAARTMGGNLLQDLVQEEVKLRERLVAIMSGIVRRGLWRIPRRLRVVAIMGGVQLDLREAELPPGVTEIRAFIFMGGLDVRVPPGVRLETDGVAIMGGFEDKLFDAGSAGRDAPIVRVTGVAIMGGVTAQVQAVGAED